MPFISFRLYCSTALLALIGLLATGPLAWGQVIQLPSAGLSAKEKPNLVRVNDEEVSALYRLDKSDDPSRKYWTGDDQYILARFSLANEGEVSKTEIKVPQDWRGKLVQLGSLVTMGDDLVAFSTFSNDDLGTVLKAHRINEEGEIVEPGKTIISSRNDIGIRYTLSPNEQLMLNYYFLMAEGGAVDLYYTLTDPTLLTTRVNTIRLKVQTRTITDVSYYGVEGDQSTSFFRRVELDDQGRIYVLGTYEHNLFLEVFSPLGEKLAQQQIYPFTGAVKAEPTKEVVEEALAEPASDTVKKIEPLQLNLKSTASSKKWEFKPIYTTGKSNTTIITSRRLLTKMTADNQLVIAGFYHQMDTSSYNRYTYASYCTSMHNRFLYRMQGIFASVFDLEKGEVAAFNQHPFERKDAVILEKPNLLDKSASSLSDCGHGSSSPWIKRLSDVFLMDVFMHKGKVALLGQDIKTIEGRTVGGDLFLLGLSTEKDTDFFGKLWPRPINVESENLAADQPFFLQQKDRLLVWFNTDSRWDLEAPHRIKRRYFSSSQALIQSVVNLENWDIQSRVYPDLTNIQGLLPGTMRAGGNQIGLLYTKDNTTEILSITPADW